MPDNAKKRGWQIAYLFCFCFFLVFFCLCFLIFRCQKLPSSERFSYANALHFRNNPTAVKYCRETPFKRTSCSCLKPQPIGHISKVFTYSTSPLYTYCTSKLNLSFYRFKTKTQGRKYSTCLMSASVLFFDVCQYSNHTWKNDRFERKPNVKMAHCRSFFLNVFVSVCIEQVNAVKIKKQRFLMLYINAVKNRNENCTLHGGEQNEKTQNAKSKKNKPQMLPITINGEKKRQIKSMVFFQRVLSD